MCEQTSSQAEGSGCKLRLKSKDWHPANERCYQFLEENSVTETYREQLKVENKVSKLFKTFEDADIDETLPVLFRENHVKYLRKGLKQLPQTYETLDASHPWLIYWIVHSLSLLSEPIEEEQVEAITNYLASCQCDTGGFAGGDQQQAHLAPTYAAVNALCILGTTYQPALQVVNRETMTNFLMRMRNDDGSFKVEEDGEADTRGAYCAASVAVLTNLDVTTIFNGTAEWIARCQTYEGGFSGVPDMEAHGGYSFCAFAALILLGHEHMCDISALLRWVVNRQMRYEGGFQGRTNKLVDGCYSFWQAGLITLIHNVLLMCDNGQLDRDKWLFDTVALQEYLLICCQHNRGGLLDKPGRPTDYYHTCYCLSGLSLAQHYESGDLYKKHIIGNEQVNKLAQLHPVHNISVDAVDCARTYFSDRYSHN